MFHNLTSFGQAVAVIDENHKRHSYDDLCTYVDNFSRKLCKGPGLVLLEAENSLNCLVAYIACIQNGYPVVITDGKNFEESEELLQQFSFKYRYQAPNDQLAILDPDPSLNYHPELALMLSTSGSTGATKFVCLSRTNIEENASSIIEYLEITAEDITPLSLPFFYSYGLSIVNSYLSAGATLLLTSKSVTEASFWRDFDQFECTGFAGVPYSYEVLEKLPFYTQDRPTLRYCTQAGGKLSAELVKKIALRSEQEGWEFYVMYGQTEAAPRISYLPPDQAAKHPESIGIPIPNGNLYLVDENDNPIDQPDIKGELVYSGPNVMLGYAESDTDLNQLEGQEFLHTGDIAYRDENGLYYLVGRMKRFLKLFGLRISQDEVEAHLHKEGYQIVWTGNDDEIHILTTNRNRTEDIRRLVADKIGITLSSVLCEEVDDFPRFPNGKIDYPACKELAITKTNQQKSKLGRLKKLLKKKYSQELQGNPVALLAQICEDTLGKEVTDTSLSIKQIGADSLSLMNIRLEMEKYFQSIPKNWLNLSIAELAYEAQGENKGLIKKHLSLQHIETEVLLRAFAIFAVVAHHFDFFYFPGGTTSILFILSGAMFIQGKSNVLFSHRSTKELWDGFIAIAVTLVFSTVVMLTGHLYFETDWHISLLLPFENLSGYLNDFFGIVDKSHHVLWLWFIHAYLQVFLVILLALSIPWVRKGFSEKPYRRTCYVFAGCVALSVISILLDSSRVDLDHSAALLKRSPQVAASLIFLGAMFALTRTNRQVIISLVSAVFLVVLHFIGFMPTVSPQIIALVIAALFVLPHVKLPRSLVNLFLQISNASFFIYLIHMPLRKGLEKGFNLEFSPPVMTTLAIVIAVISWPCWLKLVLVPIQKKLNMSRRTS